VGNLIWILLEIYCSLQQWKNFANRSRINRVVAMVRVAPFLTHGVDLAASVCWMTSLTSRDMTSLVSATGVQMEVCRWMIAVACRPMPYIDWLTLSLSWRDKRISLMIVDIDDRLSLCLIDELQRVTYTLQGQLLLTGNIESGSLHDVTLTLCCSAASIECLMSIGTRVWYCAWKTDRYF